ncbi:methyl-accepting chemotaxis protein [Paenibacillus chondroitinus]|uniref:Methyl-accepting chemotaxis protein n=1 Tax=Paenibacillus chondroitinus TaxID=59842 RepID=A0ABU6DMQ5_9BACL|nr:MULTISPECIES: methyl-accepting chemotaxis protein [Paenibacillus]MCY9657440.1 methyl-accepting chemotaxis protein [Paenibacillus anseongense]MEB4799064.1 methyl-accepting chemotaxis protein [Paenibacillus chondroitinus]
MQEKKISATEKKRFSISLRGKIVGTFVIVSLLVAVTSGLSYTYLNKVDRSYSKLLNDHVTILRHVAEIKEKTQIQNSLLLGYVLNPTKEKEKFLTETNAGLSDIIGQMSEFAKNEDEQGAIQSMADSNQTFMRLVNKVAEYADKGNVDLAKAEAMQWAIPTTETLTQSAAKIEELERAVQEVDTARNHDVVQSTVRTLIWVSVAAFVFALAIGLLLSRTIVNPIRSMVRAAERIADCDLSSGSIYVSNRDELRDLAMAFNGMKANLHSLISQVGSSAQHVAAASDALSNNAEQVSESSERITYTIQEISTGTDAQVRSVQQGVSIMEEMSAAVIQIVGVTQSANQQSLLALEAAGAGNTAVETAITQMQAISQKMKVLVESVQRLGERSEQIVQANAIIAGIARQTNMLALNASIEAARAGAAGKGFAVVADEVRKLALQTGAAAEEVTQLVSSIQEETSVVMNSTQAGSQEVETGLEVVGVAQATFLRISDAMDDVARQIAEVAASSAAISAKTSAAVDVIRGIDEVAGQTASGARNVSSNIEGQYASMEEIVSSASVLSSMAGDLQGLIARFRV